MIESDDNGPQNELIDNDDAVELHAGDGTLLVE
jgi:hypothetical protein